MTNYARGAAFERQVKADLEAMGYYVIRSAGSRGAADLYAGSANVSLLVQCKIDGRINAAERARLRDAARLAGALALIVFRGPEGLSYYELESTDGSWSGSTAGRTGGDIGDIQEAEAGKE